MGSLAAVLGLGIGIIVFVILSNKHQNYWKNAAKNNMKKKYDELTVNWGNNRPSIHEFMANYNDYTNPRRYDPETGEKLS